MGATSYLNRFFSAKKIKIRTDFTEHSVFYFVAKDFINDYTLPVFVIFVVQKEDDTLEYLYPQFMGYPKTDLPDNKYLKECTHLLISEYIPFNETEAHSWINRFKNYETLKKEITWTYPL